MGNYLARAVDPSLIPPGKKWCLCRHDGDIYFCLPNTGEPVEVTPEMLDALLPLIRAVYASQEPELAEL
jgi:hypothetical protein